MTEFIKNNITYGFWACQRPLTHKWGSGQIYNRIVDNFGEPDIVFGKTDNIPDDKKYVDKNNGYDWLKLPFKDNEYSFGYWDPPYDRMYKNEGKEMINKIFDKLVEKTFLGYPKTALYYTPKLRNINIGLTGSCNLKCSMCFCNRNDNKLMNTDLFMKILKDIKGHDVAVGLNFAGESLLHPDFDFFASVCKQYSKNICLSTNGMLIHKHLDSLSNYIDSLSISLDGLSKVNESIRLGSNTKLIEQNIKLLMNREVRPNINVAMTVTTQTQKDIDEFIKYWFNKVDYIRIRPGFNADAGYYKSCLNVSKKTWPYCPFLNNYLGISYNGDITNCCIDLAGKQSFINLKDTNVLDAWRSDYLKQLRYKFLTGSLSKNSLCGNCKVWPTYNNVIEYRRKDKNEVLSLIG